LDDRLAWSDICLGYLYIEDRIGFKMWRCRFETAGARAASSVRPAGLTGGPNAVTGVLDSCYTPRKLANEPTSKTWSFIYQPVPIQLAKGTGLQDWWSANIVWVLIAVVLVCAFIAAVCYGAKRLHRYRSKYHEERAAVDRMQEEVDEMNQFGGRAGNKDDEVAMTDNPLVTQVKDIQQQLSNKDMELKEARLKEAQDASEKRQDHIEVLKNDRDGLQAELDRLQEQMALQRAASAGVAGAAAKPAKGTAAPSSGGGKRVEAKPVAGAGVAKKRDL